MDLSAWAPQAGATGLLLASVWLVLTGRVIPRSLHDEVRADRDSYRAAADTALAASAEAAASVRQLVSAVEQLADTQRETLALVKRLVPQDRGQP